MLSKHKQAAQKIVLLLVELAHNVFVWWKAWLGKPTCRFKGFGIVRLVREQWAVPGRVKLTGESMRRVWLNREYPRARDVARELYPRRPKVRPLGFLGQVLAAAQRRPPGLDRLG